MAGRPEGGFEVAASEKGLLLTHTLLRGRTRSETSSKSTKRLGESFGREREFESLERITLEVSFLLVFRKCQRTEAFNILSPVVRETKTTNKTVD